MPPAPPHRVDILGFADAQLLDITGPAQVFASANELSPRGRLYDIAVVAEGSEVQSSAGIVLGATPLPPAPAGPATVIVAGGHGVNAACDRPALAGWVRDRAAAGARMASVCSGAFLLAGAGLLDGRRAVTHWNRLAEFRARFPAVRLESDPIFVEDGGIWSSAGVTAGIDLALALVEADHGPALALAVARELVVFLKRPGGQSQYSAALELQGTDARFEALHAWIAANLTRRLDLASLADRAGMSQRSFARHYRARTGHTPAEAVELMRVEAARRLLEQGASIATTARRTGFGATETLRRAFLRRLGTGPAAYRARFHG